MQRIVKNHAHPDMLNCGWAERASLVMVAASCLNRWTVFKRAYEGFVRKEGLFIDEAVIFLGGKKLFINKNNNYGMLALSNQRQ